MRKKGQLTVIKDAFLNEVPVGQEWFEKRMEICGGCEYNTANNPPENILTKFRKIIDGGKPHCLACGCYITEKCASKEETCGLIKLNEKPKWNALVLTTLDEDDFNIHNNSPDKVNLDLSPDGTKYMVNYGIVSEASNTHIEFLLEGQAKIVSVTVGCGCTLAAYKTLSPSLTQVNVSLNMKAVGRGIFTKNVYVKYTLNEKTKTVAIALTGTKI